MWVFISIITSAAVLMFGIGIYQWRSEKPARLSTGEATIDPSELTDVKAWNRKHGMMWILYGVIMVAGFAVSLTIDNSLYAGLVAMAAIFLPLILIPVYHNYLLKKYRRSEKE